MSELDFKQLQTLHEQYLREQPQVTEETKADFIVRIKKFIEDAKNSSRNIDGLRERDQLRANLRYWANYIYENGAERTFPNIELVPSSGAKNRMPGFVIPLVIVFLGLLVIGFFVFGVGSKSAPVSIDLPVNITQTPTRIPDTEVPVIATMEHIQPMVSTPTPYFSPTPEASAGFTFSLSSPENGASISPETEFRGEYKNLNPDWSIHLVFVKGDKFFPFAGFYKIPANVPDGSWSIPVNFAQDSANLEKAESYTIILALSLDETARNTLLSHVRDGISINTSLKNVILFNNTSRVFYRKAYKPVSGPRLVYALGQDGRPYDLFLSDLQGKEIIPLTNTSNISEKFPSFSPDGKKILYVKGQRDTSGVYSEAIYLMDIDGKNDTLIKQFDTGVVRYPRFSPDLNSQNIAYVYGDVSNSGSTLWSVHVFNTQTQTDVTISGTPELNSNRFYSWLPDGKIIYEARSRQTSSGGFMKTSVDSPDQISLFYDLKTTDEQQPSVVSSHFGSMFTFVAQDQDFKQDMYLVVISDGASSLAGSAIKLNVANGLFVSPVWEESSSSVFYVRNDRIWTVRIEQTNGVFAPAIGSNRTDGEHFGDLVVDPGANLKINSMDVGDISAYFELP